MKRFGMKLMLGLLAIGVLATLIPQQVMAVGTASNTTITNNATLSYEIGGAEQTEISDSTPPSFVVDNVVDFVVEESGVLGYNSVYPNTPNQVLSFTVTNTGNTNQDFDLSVSPGSDPHGETDSFDAINVRVFVESGGDTVYDSVLDSATHINGLAPDTTITVYVVANIPNTAISDDIAAYTLTATAHDDDGADTLGGILTETTGPDTTNVDIVFTNAVTVGQNAQFSDSDSYKVSAAQLTINKTATVIWDPINLTTNPKHIPGALVQYVVTVNNASTATASATLTTISDALNANTAFDPNFIVAATQTAESGTGLGFKVELPAGRTTASPKYYTTDNGDVDGLNHDGSATGGTVTAAMGIVLPPEGSTYEAGELKPNETVTLTFNVIIQ